METKAQRRRSTSMSQASIGISQKAGQTTGDRHTLTTSGIPDDYISLFGIEKIPGLSIARASL